MAKFKNYLSFVKFSHSIFAMPFAILGVFLAFELNEIEFEWTILIFIILCMIFARNAAMGFNRYLDREIDSKNPRTKNREIPSGILSPKAALIFVFINSALFIATTFFINNLVFLLSPIALLIVLGYSYTKRFTIFCHFVLGLGLALAPIGAYLAVVGEFNSIIPIIIYASQDVNFDEENKLHSVPTKLGVKKALKISAISHLVSASLIISIGFFNLFSNIYWLAAFAFLILLLNQHRLVNHKDLSKVNLAFFTLNGFASILYAIIAIISIYF
jgi:4-hydroxybenzoate polyprenyltransferase